MVGHGNRLFQEAQKTQARANYERAMPVLNPADTLSGGGDTRGQARLLIGASHLVMGRAIAFAAEKQKSSDLAREAIAHLKLALPVLRERPHYSESDATRQSVADHAARLCDARCGGKSK